MFGNKPKPKSDSQPAKTTEKKKENKKQAKRDALKDIAHEQKVRNIPPDHCPHKEPYDSVGPTPDPVSGRLCTIHSCPGCGKIMRKSF